jgi:hypothetical protein
MKSQYFSRQSKSKNTLFSYVDLSECQLMQLPDAVFHLMRETPVKSVDLARNVLFKIPAKLH